LGINPALQATSTEGEEKSKKSRPREVVDPNQTQQERALGIKEGVIRNTQVHAGVFQRVNYTEDARVNYTEDSDGHESKKQRVEIITHTALETETRVVVYKPVEETRLVLYEPVTDTMEVDLPKNVVGGSERHALSADEQAELQSMMTNFVSQMKPSLGLYRFKTKNLLSYIEDTKYNFNPPPTTGKPSPYLNDKDRIVKRMQVFTDTMKYLGYSSKKKRGSDETEWSWDPFKTVFTIFDACTKENLQLSPDGVFTRTAGSNEWKGANTARKATCSLRVKCPTALAELLRNIKASVFSAKNKQFCEMAEYEFMTQEKLGKVLELNDPEVYFFPQMRLDYDKYPQLFEMKNGNGRIVKLPALLNLRITATERMMTANALMADMYAQDMLVVFGPEQCQQAVLFLEN
jgi:hypothetical protein